MDTVNVIVEIPRFSQNKYEYDHETDTIKLDRHLLVAMGYPAEYGFIPDTLGGDGDPLDVLVITSFQHFRGVSSCRRSSYVHHDRRERSGREAHCGASYDKNWKSATDITDVPDEILARIRHFFTVYKDLDEGKWVKVENYAGRDEALKVLQAARDAYVK